MELKRVMGRLAPRWPVLVIAGLIGAIAAFVFVNQRNSEVEPVYSAEATVTLPTLEADDGRGQVTAISGELTTALELAKTVNETELRHDTRFIEADGATNTLIFQAIESTEEAAINAAQAMRQAYVNEDPAFDVNAELAKKLAEANVISGRLDELIPDEPAPVVPPIEESAAADARLSVLQSQRAALEAKIAELHDTRLDAASEDIAGIDASIERYQGELATLLVLLGPLEDAVAAAAAEGTGDAGEGTDQVPDYGDLPLADQWSIQALEARLTELQTESASLIVASVTGTGIVLPDAEVVDETPTVTPTWLGLLVGFLAGIILWSAVLLGFDRARGIVWQAGDIKNVSVLAEGPAIAMNDRDASDLELHRRKRSVQAVRSAIIGAGRLGQGTIVGFASPPSTDPDVRDDLARDVSASLSAVGRSVLVVDLGFTGTSPGRATDGSGLRALFHSVSDDENTIRERAAAAIDAADRRAPGLDVLIADSDIIDPADILAGRPLTELLNQAREQYDVVLVIQPTTTVNSGAGVDAYLQQQVIVCTRGKTRVSELNTIAIPRDAAHVQLVGAAILVPYPGDRPRRPAEPIEDGQSEQYAASGTDGRGAKVTSKLKRLGPNERESGDPSRDRLRALDSYSVEESALLQSESSPERP
ncbi:MAG: hypothetical protein WD274_11025 [Acidimicrobiia bacterium]